EIQALTDLLVTKQVAFSLTQVWAKGGAGGLDLAEKVVAATRQASDFNYLYALNDSIPEKIKAIVTKIYGGASVSFSKKAQTQMTAFEKQGWSNLPICMAKTQYSFSDDQTLLGAPEGFDITIRELVPKLGAGFIVALTGDIMTMPGLPKKPAALNMDVDNLGNISGLF
ncbi:MAG: formate--tetrahydrofolate ligase, partial [Lactococcus sp.]|nr:formate--tetrahydrofolate ligase [Lactococcus sp.]